MMKIFSTIFVYTMLGSSAAFGGEPANWELVWADEFDDPTIDSSKWNHEVNAWGGGNNELQYYTDRPNNSRVENGHLIIEAHKERFTGPEGTRDYTSARLNSRFKGDWLYGRFEIRAKLPSGQGLWPAIWMLPTDYDYGGWAASGEIDIMEFRGDEPNSLVTTIHHGGEWPDNFYTGTSTSVPNLSEDFYTYALEWEPTELRWYFEGEEVYRLNDWVSANGDYPAPFDRRFHLLLNVAVGGNFLPDPPANADYFPQRMEIDYVRVYQSAAAEQMPFLGNPIPVPGTIQAEHFDLGGENIAYVDSTEENLGQAYRLDEAVDVGSSGDIDGTPSIGWFADGEWVEYTVNVAESGLYKVDARYATMSNAPMLRLQEIGSAEQIEETFPTTEGWTVWQTEELGLIDLEAGETILRLSAPTDAINVNWLNLTNISTIESEWWVVK